MPEMTLVEKLRSQIGDDVQHIYDHEALFRLSADRIEDLEGKLHRSTTSIVRWRENSVDTWSAMQAMRNDLNEHVPLPSMEADLLEGPEASAFCAKVAEAVCTRITLLEAQLADAKAELGRLIADAVRAESERCDPKVKPLVWDGRKTDSVMFQYRVHIGYGQMSGVFALTLSGSTIGEFNSEEDAKAAAQEDYEHRVLSALVNVREPTIAASAQAILSYFEAHPDSPEPQNWQAVFDAMREVHGETHSNDHYARMIEAMLAQLGAVKGESGE